MAHKKYGPAMPRDITDFTETFLLESHIADGEDFVHQQNLGFEMSRYCKCHPRIHTARKVFDGSVDEVFDLCKRDDLVEFSCNFGTPHAENGAAQEDIFPAR